MPSEEKSILRETLSTIRNILGPEADDIAVERAVIGLFFTGVKLNNGSAGACATPIKTIPEAVCCPSSAMAMPFPGKLHGRPALDLAEEALGDPGIRRAVGPLPQLPASQCQPRHKCAKHSRDSVRGIPEYQTGQTDPDHFVNETGRAGKKENEVENRA